ncbi:hypothetical protein ACFWD7_54605, partial [Streptomyces mirabilis]|uniref:hypothetical protein n=1 Tax=Streptomyces mirabilis TaxID=68239 RepID=UPI0036AF1A1D
VALSPGANEHYDIVAANGQMRVTMQACGAGSPPYDASGGLPAYPADSSRCARREGASAACVGGLGCAGACGVHLNLRREELKGGAPVLRGALLAGFGIELLQRRVSSSRPSALT